MLLINVCWNGHSNFVIFYRISFKFHIWIAFIKLSFKFEYRFCLTNDNQDNSPISVRCRGHCNLVIFYRISSKFHVWIASIKLLFKFEYKFSPMNDIKMADKMAAAYQFSFVDNLP